MTKKHFDAIANALKLTRPEEAHIERRCQWESTRDVIIHMLQYTNASFDKQRFIQATEAPREETP